MITINDLDKSENFFLMASPCVIEGENIALCIAEKMMGITEKLHISYIFKGSYQKTNHSCLDSFTDVGGEKALKILRKVGETSNTLTVTDIHETTEVAMAAEHVDVLQIPAFLCRQTDLSVAVAETGKIVSMKKGQFLSSDAMRFAVQKVIDAGNGSVIITEQETTSGCTDLVVDFRGILQMQTFGFPVITDTAHFLQQPNRTSGVIGGLPTLIEAMAKTAIAIGASGLSIEAYPEPSQAKFDRASILRLDLLGDLLTCLVRLHRAILQETRGPY